MPALTLIDSGLLNLQGLGENAHHFAGAIDGHRTTPLARLDITSLMQAVDHELDGVGRTVK